VVKDCGSNLALLVSTPPSGFGVNGIGTLFAQPTRD